MENSLSNYYSNQFTVLNHQELFIYIYAEHFKSLDIKYKIILFDRLVRGNLKVYEYSPSQSKIMGEKLLALNKVFYLIINQPKLLKIIHKILQKTSFKINF